MLVPCRSPPILASLHLHGWHLNALALQECKKPIQALAGVSSSRQWPGFIIKCEEGGGKLVMDWMQRKQGVMNDDAPTDAGMLQVQGVIY